MAKTETKADETDKLDLKKINFNKDFDENSLKDT